MTSEDQVANMAQSPRHDAAAAPGHRSFRVAAISFLIIMVDGYDTLMIAFIAPLLTDHWGLQPPEIGRIFATGYVGAILGALGIGTLADRFGRRPALIAALLLAAAATILCAFAETVGTLMLLRFVAGIGLGGALPAVSALTAEHAKPGRRSGTVTLMYLGFPMGAVVGGGLTALLLDHGWRSIFAYAGCACLVAACLALALPESFRRAGHDARRSPELRPKRGIAATVTEQFADGRLRPALTLWLGLFCMLLLTYFLLSWTPSIIIAHGGSARLAALAGVVLNLGGITGAILMTPAINRFGPYRPIALMVAIGAILVALIGQVPGSLSLTMVLLFGVGICVMGGQLNVPAMAVDLFPPHVRGAGAGWTAGIGRIGSIVGPLVGGALIAAQPATATLFLIAALPATVAAAAFFAAARLRGSRRAGDG